MEPLESEVVVPEDTDSWTPPRPAFTITPTIPLSPAPVVDKTPIVIIS